MRGRRKSAKNQHTRCDAGSLCRLRTCKRPYVGRKGGKAQGFCSPSCRLKFHSLAHKVGASLLDREATDSSLGDLVSNLLNEGESSL